MALTHETLALPPTCYGPSIAPRIIGGTQAATREFPFLAQVRTETSLCGGSLIAPGWVLTAAHCGNVEYVVMGKSTLDAANDPCEERINVQTRYPHPQYNKDAHSNDIQLLKLQTASTYTPVKLWDGVGNEGAVGSYCTVAGWGTLSQDSQTASNFLMKVSVPIQSNTKCSAQYPGVITNKLMCAGEDAGGKDSCTGDSGGPLFTRDATAANSFVQVGLVSFGKGCGQANAYGVYTRITSYADWICKTSGVCGAVAPTAPAPTPKAPTPVPKVPTPQPRGPTAQPPTRRNCRTCVWCLSSLPMCPRSPPPTPEPTPEPTPAPAPAPAPGGGGGLFGGLLGNLLGLQMLLGNNNNNNNGGRRGRDRNPWDNDPWDNNRRDNNPWDNNNNNNPWDNNNNGWGNNNPLTPYQPWSPPTPSWSSPWTPPTPSSWGSPWTTPATSSWPPPAPAPAPWTPPTPSWSTPSWPSASTTPAWPSQPYATPGWGSTVLG